MEANKNLENYHGTFMWKDIPLIDIEVINWEFKQFQVYEENKFYLPLKLQNFVSIHGFEVCLRDRLFPETRQNLKDVLSDLGIESYALNAIIKANYGLNTDDHRWFKPYGSSLVYDDIKIRY